MDWSDSWRDAFRIELRAEAVGLAWRGWPVLPGSYPDLDGHWLGGDGSRCAGLMPIHDDWADRGATAPERTAQFWNGAPYSLLVATGTVLDAVEVNDHLGRRVAAVLRGTGVPVPIVATPDGRWLFLTEVGSSPMDPQFASHGVRLHSTGSYIPVPPSPSSTGIVHWRVKPQVCGWRLPAVDVVYDAVVRALGDPANLALAHPIVALAGIQRLSA
ncbi:MAG: bifunctional DNA primase/polymerase [Sciscionella sp.]